VVLPHANAKDWEELPAHLKEGLEVHFARTYDDVFKPAFQYDPTLATRVAAESQAAHPAHDGGAGASGGATAAARRAAAASSSAVAWGGAGVSGNPRTGGRFC